MSRYPPAAQWPVAYNVRQGELPEESNLLSDDTVYWLTTKAHLGDPDAEREVVAHLLFDVVAEYLEEIDFPELTELLEPTWYPFYIGEGEFDRTLNVIIPDERALSVELVQVIQEKVLARFSYWRVHIHEDYERCDLDLAIYPDAVSLGWDPEVADLEAAIERWRAGIWAFREPTRGPKRRQLQYLKLHVPHLLQQMESVPVVHAATFDNRRGDCTCCSVWFLCEGPRSYRFVVDVPEDVMHGDAYPVDHCGHIQSDNPFIHPDFPNIPDPPFWLCCWVLPGTGHTKVVLREFNPNTGKTWMIQLDPHEIITDAELKSMEEDSAY